MGKSRLWAFTSFDVHTEDDDHPTYGEYGQCQLERTTTGKLHWQGFAHFKNAINNPKQFCKTDHVHWEAAKGTLEDNEEYTSKDATRVRGPFKWGDRPPPQPGKRTDLELACTIAQQGDCGLKRLREEHPTVYVKYYKGLERLAKFSTAHPVLPLAELRPWQSELLDTFTSDDSDRHIYFVFDGKGGSGKSSLTRHLSATYGAFVTDGGKYADMAHAYNKQPIVVFDIPRTFSGQGIPDDVYGFCEKLKDGMLWSPKYESETKFFKPPKVIIFANTLPNRSKWTDDRLIEYTLHDGSLCKEGSAQPFQARSQAQ